MGRPKKSTVARRNLPAATNQQTVVDAVARIHDFYELGVTGYSDGTLAAADRAGTQFTTWLNNSGLSLEDLAAVAPRRNHGQPVMAASIVALWAETKASNVKTSKTLKTSVGYLAVWLRHNHWDTSCLDGTSTSGKKLRSAIDAMCAHMPTHITTQARAYTQQEIDSIVAAIDANSMGWNDLTVQAMRTYVILGFAMAMRGGELCNTLRWDMVDIDGEVVNLPGGNVFKKQARPATLPIPHNHRGTCGPNCPVGALATWKTTCEAHGIPTVDTLVFPAIRQQASWNLHQTVAVFGDKSFIADPVAHTVALRGDTPKNRTNARDNQHGRYRCLWNEACAAAGIEADHQWQRTSTHGMRRGAATTAVRNGVPEVVVSQRLRHADIDTTSGYIDRTPADTTSLNHISADQNDRLAETGLVGADQLRKTCQVTHDGVACGREFTAHIDIDGDRVPACPAHRKRNRKGKTGDDLTRPIARRP